MKAYVRPHAFLNDRQRKMEKELLQKLSIQMVEKERQRTFARYVKISLLALNEQFGFGKKRLMEYIAQIDCLSSEWNKGPEFWDLVDMRLEQIGMSLPKEDYDELEQIWDEYHKEEIM